MGKVVEKEEKVVVNVDLPLAVDAKYNEEKHGFDRYVYPEQKTATPLPDIFGSIYFRKGMKLPDTITLMLSK